jgi:hypothetical protein
MKEILVSAVILVALTGCAGNGRGGGTGTVNHLTQAQAQQVGTAISTDLTNALSSALTSPAVALGISSRDHIRAALERRSEAKAVPRPDTVTCSGSSCTISGTYTCPDGGSIGVSGDISATSNSVSETVTETPSNCSDGTVVINGDPNISVDLQASDNGITTTANIRIDGGVSWSPVQAGQFPSGSSSFNLTLSGTVNDSSQTVTACSISGSIDGQSFSSNCSNVP